MFATEWVELDVDGVQRGEIYLEMTYYSNEPEPEKPSQPAAAPKNKILSNFLESDSLNLQRRPSKLLPADRLSRPRQTSEYLGSGQSTFDPQPPGAFPQSSYSPPVQQQPLPIQGGRLPASLTPSYGTPSQSRRDALPPPSGLENHESSLPSLLRPGGGRTPPSSSPIHTPQHIFPASYGDHRRPSPSPPSRSPYLGPQFGTPPSISINLNPYVGGATTPGPPGLAQNPHIIGQPLLQNQNGPPGALWRQESYSTSIFDSGIQGVGGFAIPISVNAGPPIQGYSSPPPQIGYGGNPRPTHVRSGSDPALLTRYSSPLPLPPGATTRPQPVALAPAFTPTPEIAPSSYPPVLPSKEYKPSPDQPRVETLRVAEEEAKRKHEQELRDLELAMQLDRELNFS